MSKYFTIILICTLTGIILCSCDDSETVYKQGYKEGAQKGFGDGYKRGYQKGSHDTVNAIKEKAGGIRGTLKKSISDRMIIGAFLFVCTALFGAKLVDALRIRFSRILKIPIKVQVATFISLYILICLACMIWIFSSYSPILNIPILILMAGTFYPFWYGYIPALKKDDRIKRRLNMAKVKSMGFLSLVLIMVYQILENGIEGVI